MINIHTKYKENWRTLLEFRPTHPSHPMHPTRKLGATRLVCKLRWTPKGECSCSGETSAAIIKKIIWKWYFSKYLNFPTWHQIFNKMTKKARCRLCFWNTLLLAWFLKNHVKVVNLKILPPPPNLTWNFETHKNVGDNFFFRIQVDIYIIYIPTKYEEI